MAFVRATLAVALQFLVNASIASYYYAVLSWKRNRRSAIAKQINP